MRMKEITPTNELTRKEVMSILNMSMTWCKNNLGTNKRKRSNIKLSVSKKIRPYCGEYLPDIHTIKVYYSVNLNIFDLVGTLVHEYAHSLQPCRTKYAKLLDQYGYVNHPFEIEARNIESVITPTLTSIILNRLNKE